MLETTVRRQAIADDLPTCARFWLEMYEEIGMLHRRDMAGGWEKRFTEYFTQRIQEGEARYFLALDEGRIVGTAGAVVLDGYPSAIHRIRFGYILGVRVEPEFRGQGIATALTQDAVAFLKSLDCKRIRLHASEAGRPIYERLGFIPTNEMQLQSSW